MLFDTLFQMPETINNQEVQNSMVPIPSITGGAATAKSYAEGSVISVTQNSPFNFAAGGSKASSASSTGTGLDMNVLMLMAIMGGIVIIILK